MIKNRRKLLYLVPTVSLLLAGCGNGASTSQAESDSTEVTNGGEETNSGPVSLKVWGAEEDLDLLNTVAENFKSANSGVKIDFTFEAVDESDCKDLLLSDLSAAPDVFSFADDQLAILVAGGVLAPVPDASNVSSRNTESSAEAASINNTLYAYPLTADNGYFMYYNKAYFSDTDVQTLDGMLSVASSKGKKITMDWGSGWYLYSFFGNTGLEVGINDDGISNHCNWNSTEGPIKGVDIAQAMMDIAKNKGFMSGGDESLINGAKDDSVIAGISGIWSSTTLSQIWGNNFGAVKLPTYTCAGQQVQMSSYAGYKMIGVNHYSSNEVWANKFAEYLSNEENQKLRFEMRGQGPSNINAAASDEVVASPAIQAVISQSEFASLQRIGGAYWEPVGNFGSDMLKQDLHNMKLQELMDKLVADITASNT